MEEKGIAWIFETWEVKSIWFLQQYNICVLYVCRFSGHHQWIQPGDLNVRIKDATTENGTVYQATKMLSTWIRKGERRLRTMDRRKLNTWRLWRNSSGTDTDGWILLLSPLRIPVDSIFVAWYVYRSISCHSIFHSIIISRLYPHLTIRCTFGAIELRWSPCLKK